MAGPEPSLMQRLGDAEKRSSCLGHTITADVLREAMARIAELEAEVENLGYELMEEYPEPST